MQFLADRIVWPATPRILPVFTPDWSMFPWTCLALSVPEISYWGFDDWLGHFPRQAEIDLIAQALELAHQGQRFHIRGISTYEWIEMMREYYQTCGYEDALAKNYTLPRDVLLTVSTTLRHSLWCEKDKSFLAKKDTRGHSLWALCPPLRTPADLRSLQQALRMGSIMGMEVFPGDEPWLSDLLAREILSPFQISQMIHYRWLKYGFSGMSREVMMEFPDFSLPESEEIKLL